MSSSTRMLASDLAIAWRNLRRNWRRSFTTMAALTVGISMLLLFGGFTRAIMATLETGIVSTTGHLHVQMRDYARYGFGNSAQYSVDNIQRVDALIASDPELSSQVRLTTPLLLFQGLVSRYDTGVSRMMSGEGVNPDDQRRLREWNAHNLRTLPNDGFVLASTPQDGAVVGTNLARILGYCEQLHVDNCPASTPAPGAADVRTAGAAAGNPATQMPQALAAPMLDADTLDLTAAEARGGIGETPKADLLVANNRGAPNVVTVRLQAAENQGLEALDSSYVVVPIALARQLMYGRDAASQATFLVVQLHSTDDLHAAKERLNQLLRDNGLPMYAADFTQYFPEYNQVKLMFRTIFGFIAVLMGIIVLFTIANTMSTSVIERTDEIGTLRALGVRPAGVQRLFLLEGLLLGLIGVGAGVVVSLIVALLVNNSGMTWVPPNRVVPVPLTVSFWESHALVAGVALSLLMLAVLSSWWPARSASRSPIVEALRHV
ncbi:FtsX-like permease family protein [Xanthomonas hydrangeae]|uniref:FtsX-like permease family protein n=1 Tax=Xanthomonas hydrangeae TaxID=2775159 RepID=A0AAU0B7J6_9XANT|nr:FtsX-like permease family protein [Xanthomonas hydrangeae]WOB47941.1 FtsX-like permease family protein [Xanthomonas hydrangeae]